MVSMTSMSKEEKTARFVRLSVLLSGFILLLCGFMFVLPVFFPEFVLGNITNKNILQRAYYHADDSQVTHELFKAISGDITTANPSIIKAGI